MKVFIVVGRDPFEVQSVHGVHASHLSAKIEVGVLRQRHATYVFFIIERDVESFRGAFCDA